MKSRTRWSMLYKAVQLKINVSSIGQAQLSSSTSFFIKTFLQYHIYLPTLALNSHWT